jgi:hypothetical protein
MRHARAISNDRITEGRVTISPWLRAARGILRVIRTGGVAMFNPARIAPPPSTENTLALLAEAIKKAEKQMAKNMSQCFYGEDEVEFCKRPSQFQEWKMRFSNAYDCLVKGVDPYDY